MSSTSENGAGSKDLPQTESDKLLAGNALSRDGETSSFQPAPGSTNSAPSAPRRPDWEPAEQESLILRHPSLTGLINPALLSGSAEEHVAGGDALPGARPPQPASPTSLPSGPEPDGPGAGKTETTAQQPLAPSDPSQAARPPTPSSRKPPLGSPRKPPLPPGPPPTPADSAALPARRVSGVGQHGEGDVEQGMSEPLLAKGGGGDGHRTLPWAGFGAGAPRFTPESTSDTAGNEELSKSTRQRHLSLPNMIGSLFGIKPSDQTEIETATAPNPEGVSHLRGGSFGLPNYAPGRGPPAALASPSPGRRGGRAGSWAPGGHVILIQPQPLPEARPIDPNGKADSASAPVSSVIFEDREEELGEDEVLCRICLDTLIMDGMESMKMQCKCKGELALAHKECAVKWFTIRGSRICDVCGSEVENLPVLVYRRPAPRVLVPMRHVVPMEQEDILLRQEPPGMCLDYPVLVLATILLHFCFIQQLLVKDLGQTALLVAFPFGCLLGIIVAVTSRATVSRLFVWLFAAFEFFLIVVYTHVFYRLLRNYEPFTSENPLAAILGLLLGAFCGLGTSLGLHTVVSEAGAYLHGRERARPMPASQWEQDRAISEFWGTDWDTMSVRSTGSRWSRGRLAPASPPRQQTRWGMSSLRNPRATRSVTPVEL